MAGGKETPRQKMIGMMYLFYTALLALQVSNSVLEKFIFINVSLERQVVEADKKNAQIIKNITGVVEEKGNRADDVKVLDKAKEVRKQTAEILKFCNALKDEMVEITGGRDENGNLVGVKDQDKVANMMINQEKGAELKQKLNDYAKFLGETTGNPEDFPPIALDGKDNPVFKNDKDQRIKEFSTLTFESTPTAAGMASVSQLETEVMSFEALALDELADQVGAKDVSFDIIIPMVKPLSNKVAAGTKYVGDLFITAAASGVEPEMFLNDKPIPVEEGFGKIEFTATPGNYDREGLAKKSFKVAIDFNDSVYEMTQEYFVVRPIIQIQSASVQALYLNCGNELNVQVPALGTAYNPVFTAQGATCLPDRSRKGYVTVIPSGRKVTLNVSSGGNRIGSESFDVRRIPKPTIVMKSGGRLVNEKQGMATCPRNLSLEAVADESFAEFLPKDARYRVSGWEVTLARGKRPLRTKQVQGPNVSLSDLASQARPGDRIVAEVKLVERMNFENKRENVNVGSVIKQFTITGN